MGKKNQTNKKLMGVKRKGFYMTYIPGRMPGQNRKDLIMCDVIRSRIKSQNKKKFKGQELTRCFFPIMMIIDDDDD